MLSQERLRRAKALLKGEVMAIKNNNYIAIQGWMINELELKGNELIIYAIIYGFSQDGEQKFTGTLQYLADATSSSRNGVAKNLKSLCEKGFLIKDEKFVNGVKFCEYRTTKFDGAYNSVVRGIQQSCTGGVQLSCTNNTNIYNTNNNLDIKESGEETPPTPPAPKENKKIKHGEYGHVRLTDDEFKKLNDEYGESNSNELIKILDEYIEMSGKKYKSHYLAIKKWVVDALREKNSSKLKPKQDNKVPDNKPIDPIEARLQKRLFERLAAGG